MADIKEVATQTPLEMAVNNQFIDKLGDQLREKEKLGLSFPKNYSVENALNAAYLMIKDATVKKNEGSYKDPKWVEYPTLSIVTANSVASSLMDMTVQALNPVKKQCYFVVRGNKLTLMRSYQGTKAVAKRVGVKKIASQVIYEGDSFKYHIVDGVKVIDEHIQDFMNIDTNKIKGAYAILTLENGDTYAEIMNINQIKAAWKKGNFDETKSTDIHNEFSDQMALKTVESRACKNFINSSDDSDLLDAFNDTSENENIDVTAVEVQHDIEINANSEQFEIPQETEVVTGEVEETVPNNAETADNSEPEFMKG